MPLQFGSSNGLQVGAVVGCVLGMPTDTVGCGIAGNEGWGTWWCWVWVWVGDGVGVLVGSTSLPNMFQVEPENCGVGNCWIGSDANSSSANVCQIRAGQ